MDKIIAVCLVMQMALGAEEIFVAADEASFLGGQMQLQGHVVAQHPFGILQSPHAEVSVDRIVCEQEVVLQLDTNQDDMELHEITAPGGASVDHAKGIARLFGKGADQVLFEDAYGEMFADTVVVEYGKGRPIQPKRIVLDGRVKVLSRYAGKDLPVSGYLQYVLADRVVFNTANQEIQCFSFGSKRVLFYDKTKSLQVSAPRLSLKRNEVTDQDQIRGGGDVRFAFNQAEMQQMLDQFNLREP